MKINQTFIKRKIAGECVLVPTGDTSRTFNGLFTLSETAEFLWDHLEAADSLDNLIAMVEEEYEVEPEEARQDTIEFLSQLLSAGFITLSDPSKEW